MDSDAILGLVVAAFVLLVVVGVIGVLLTVPMPWWGYAITVGIVGLVVAGLVL